MSQIIISRPASGIDKKSQLSWQDFAGLSWVILDDDFANLGLTK